jgi:hypothetical protein
MTAVAVKDANDAIKRDLAILDFRIEAGESRDRGGHDLRAWYKTNTIEAGADSLIIRRTTHAIPKDVDSGYERFSWATICREVSKLKFELAHDGSPPPGHDPTRPCPSCAGTGRTLPPALPLVPESLQADLKARNRWRKLVTPSGFEPVKSPARITEDRGSSTEGADRARPSPRKGVTSPRYHALAEVAAAIAAVDTERARELVQRLIAAERRRVKVDRSADSPRSTG